ncbi:dihydroxyacetone phosphate acyltransferase [Coccinella septempunctata]|uniref:dihydroxyacetone phosphate acyltransferase n=1 Tax=Coccinella septempunctata TaxID=41139 RepID=UPI001D069409|nr:dihydroxyacetone phosphate acyltransferase [Coccinella septempunctata]
MQSIIFDDILEPRRKDLSNYYWVSRKIDTTVAFKQPIRPTPESHKEDVINHIRIQELLEAISIEKRIPKEFLESQVRVILDEIGYNKNLRVIRGLALILIKICLKVCKGIYVNNDSILHTKVLMGSNPIIFVPSHRSYADFILMSFSCFTYDVEIPAIAAGMDFHEMWAMGSILRDTGAFFMRRSYNNDYLYWSTFKQYINQLVTKGELPIEFYIEGTRSRSNKSLMPKYGLLNMILKPLFLRQVPDIIFVPINISYERIMEEKLFSFELLGVPKPKESTSALFKSLSIIKERYGSIHLNFGKPISSKEFFGDNLDKTNHNIGPIHQQELSDLDKKIIPSLAHEIVHCQQKLSILNIINLIAIIVNHNLTNSKELLTYAELKDKVLWLKGVLEEFGANVWCTHIDEEMEEAFEVHKNKIFVNDGKVDVVRENIDLTNLNVTKLKAHKLSEEVMIYSVPLVMLYIYINPVLHYLIDSAIIVAVLKVKSSTTLDVLKSSFIYMRNILLYEFVTSSSNIEKEFEKALIQSTAISLIKKSDHNTYNLGHNKDMQDILISVIQPFFYSYNEIIRILETCSSCDEKTILTEAQKKIEAEMRRQFIHPYSLNLDTFSNCLSALTYFSALKKARGVNGWYYEVDQGKLLEIKCNIEPYMWNLFEGKTLNLFLKHKL